jgi:hypothetical protein
MSCSSRISRIIPGAIPLAWDDIPPEFQSPPPPAPFSEGMLIRTERRKHRPILVDIPDERSPSPRMPEVLSILPPTSPLKIISRKSPQSASSSKYEREDLLRCKSHQGRPDGLETGSSGKPPRRRSRSSNSASPSSVLDTEYPRDTLARVCSSPPFTKDTGQSQWMTVATSIHRRHTSQDLPVQSPNTTFTKIHSSRYSHVVQTDALAPNSNSQPENQLSQKPRYPSQPWVKENNEIDWAIFFRTQPLPNSATWSRLDATVQNIDETWDEGVRISSR